MWSLKFKVKNIDSVYSKLSEKHKVVDYFYPVDRYLKGKKIFILGIHTLEGEDKEINRFCNDIKKSKNVAKFERNENIIILLISEEEKFYSLLYDPELYLPSPVIVKEGYEEWNVAAWDREILEKLMNEILKWKDKLKNFELKSIEKTKLNDIYFPKIIPELPEKQKEAFRLAVENEYYTWPRKKDLSDLAKMMKISISTYQEHLRKAEAKLLPFFSRNLK
ncbi:MAG: helix-turn-helix domain-containing protein [Nanoarchaeota archaeon]